MLVRASRIAIAALTAAVLILFFRHDLFASAPAFIAIQATAAALMIWARLTFGLRSFHGTAGPTPGRLIMTGPYRAIRHPIYSAILFFVWAGVASHASLLTVALAIVAAIATLVRILTEERLLAEHFPEYPAYAARTKRLIPYVF